MIAEKPGILYNPRAVYATVAQLVEQTIRNRQVKGSTPFGGSLVYRAENDEFLPAWFIQGWMR